MEDEGNINKFTTENTGKLNESALKGLNQPIEASLNISNNVINGFQPVSNEFNGISPLFLPIQA